MFKKIIITSALLCAGTAWGSQVTTDLSTEYINNVTSHMDGLKAQKDKVEAAEAAASSARSAVRSAQKSVDAVQSDLTEANDNTSAYPRRIKRDGESIADKREESRDIFRNSFPEFSTPDEAIRSVNRSKNRLQEEKDLLEGRLTRKENEFSSLLTRARQRAKENKTALEQNRLDLRNLESQIPEARRSARDAKRLFEEKKRQKEDPKLPKRIKDAEAAVAAANQARIDEGTSCNGLSSIAKSVCRKLSRAKDHLKGLQAIAKPGSLQPFRRSMEQSRRKVTNLEERKRSLAAQTNELEDRARRSRSRVADLEEDLRIETRPIRNQIADINGQLERLGSRLAKAQRLETLASDIGSLERRVERNKARLAALPTLIEKLEGDLEGVKATLENAQEASADLAEALATEQAVLPNQVSEINRLRTEMNASLSTVVELPVAAEVTPNIDTELMPSGDWSVLTTDLDNEWNRASCRAETVEVLEETDSEVTSSASLKVVNLVNPDNGFNEPVVVMTVNSDREDLINFNKATMRASSSRTYTFDLIYSKSSKNKLFFMSDLKDRKHLIQFMLDKSSMRVKLTNINADTDDEIRFSLKGSTKALNSRSSRDNSMRNACGGIKVTEI